jgi:SAM-dependent methyltransferase
MARLASLAKAGYHPSPDPVATALGRLIAPPASSGAAALRVLDPCCADGAALLHFLDGMGDPPAKTFGIEIHAARADAARQVLDCVIRGDARHARLSTEAFQVLYLNPPYQESGDEQRRQEHAFLTWFTRVLQPSGVLVYIVPQRRLAHSAQYLATHFTSVRCWRFPDDVWEPFRQICVVAIKKVRSERDDAARDRIRAWAEGDPGKLEPLWVDRTAAPLYRAPMGRGGDVLFASGELDPQAVTEAARRLGAWSHPAVMAQLWPDDDAHLRPLMPLRKGHLAQLVAAGFLNNILLQDGDVTVLVKGRTEKRFRVVSDNENTRVEREEIATSVVLLDLQTGELRQVGSVADAGGTDDA